MARFELHDGPMKKFWEIELLGDTLHFTMGDIGAEGRLRTKRHRHEREAEEAYEKAVRAMLAQGYEQQLEADEAKDLDGPTWGRICEEPRDLEALAVHADWLIGRDDPRGDVLALEVAARQSGDAAALKKAHANRDANRASLLGDHSGFAGSVEVEWGLGYARCLTLEGNMPASPEAAVALLRHDGFSLLEELRLRVPAAVKVMLSGNYPALRVLELNSPDRGDGDLDLDRLAVKAPRLRSLRVRGPSAVMGSDVVTGLQGLDMEEAPGWLEAIVRARPALQQLAITGITEEGLLELRQQGLLESVEVLELVPAWGADLGVLLQILEGSKLDSLSLEDIRIEAGHAESLVGLHHVKRLVLSGSASEEARAVLDRRRYESSFDEDADVEEEEAPERPADLPLTKLVRGLGKKRRYWEIGVDGAVHHIHYGAGNSAGRWIWSRFPSADVAEEIALRRVEEKVREGYDSLDGESEASGPPA